MRVELVSYTRDCERLIACASKMTLSKKAFDEIWREMTENEVETWIRETITRGHLSPWEHCYYTFHIHDVSRVLTHQLVRHRIASYTQHSQRYKRLEDIQFVLPHSIADKPDLKESFRQFISKASQLYNELIDKGIPPEDARYILPQGVVSKIVVTMNARELMHFFSLRMCSRAQGEIRKLAWSMWEKVYEIHPKIWKWSGPRCVQTENLVRKAPLSITDLLRGEERGFDFISEKCPEGVPRSLILKCLRQSRE